MKTVDLRSDTVTHPTPEMRRAMYEAEVGDDGWGDDPTVRRLEERAAEMLVKEAGLFVASGTMGNLVSILTHCGRGDEIVVGDQAHIYVSEVGGASGLASVMVRQIPNLSDGTLDLDVLDAAVRRPNAGFPVTRLLCLENTHNRCNGAVLTPEYTHAVGEVASRHSASVHLDGARIFNAAVALGIPASDLARPADSVTFCLSKGLSCPVGSILCGPQDFITQARKNRRMVGGGMRQVGILAAAGLVALGTMINRLADDHANARRLVEGLANIPGIVIDPTRIQTNIVIFEMADGDAEGFAKALEARGVLAAPFGGPRVRFVTHRGINAKDVETALEVVEATLKERMALR